jgi:hypothetical protein
MATEIAGEHYGPPYRVTSTDPAVKALLEQVSRETYGRESARQGTAQTWWCSPATVRRVRELLDE